MNPRKFVPLAIAVLLLWSGMSLAQYTLVLKNGRRITVQNYREEGGMIKFYGLGGEIGIARDQVKAILKPGEQEERGMVVPGAEAVRVAPAEARPADKEAPPPKAGEQPKTQEKALSPEQIQAEERAKEEREYQKRVREITERLKSARDRYLMATRGSSGPEPTVPTTQEEMKTRADDLISRLRDAQHNPVGPSETGGVKLPGVPSSFAGSPPSTTELRPSQVAPSVDVPLPGYSEKQRELSELRNRVNQLEKERERLIQEMKQKNFDTGSLFLD